MQDRQDQSRNERLVWFTNCVVKKCDHYTITESRWNYLASRLAHRLAHPTHLTSHGKEDTQAFPKWMLVAHQIDVDRDDDVIFEPDTPGLGEHWKSLREDESQ